MLKNGRPFFVLAAVLATVLFIFAPKIDGGLEGKVMCPTSNVTFTPRFIPKGATSFGRFEVIKKIDRTKHTIDIVGKCVDTPITATKNVVVAEGYADLTSAVYGACRMADAESHLDSIPDNEFSGYTVLFNGIPSPWDCDKLLAQQM